MKIKFYANACCVYESQGRTILCDPWLVDGAFDGSWHHYPPLKTKPEDVSKADWLYLSHIHPDHFDHETLKHFRKDMPIVALIHGKNYLLKFLQRAGFTNVIRMADQQEKQLGPFKLTMFAPFTGHPFYDTAFGNPIDSALAVQADGYTVLNTNDNIPSLDAARSILERFPAITVAQLSYNAAGPYPSCFKSLKDGEKRTERKRVLERNLVHMGQIADTLNPKYIMPFAGEYVIGGAEWKKNEFLGTTTKEEVGAFISSLGFLPLVLREGETFDLDSNEEPKVPEPIQKAERDRYIQETLSKVRYPHENDSLEEPHPLDLDIALSNLKLSQADLNIWPSCKIILNWGTGSYRFEMGKEKSENLLCCYIDRRLLMRILKKDSHWNNVEIGCHIDFERDPNIYQPDVHMLMSFFHL